MRAEEGDHLPVEFDMKGRAVEALGIGADLSKCPRLIRAAGRQEGEVPGIRHRVQLRLGDKVSIDGCGVIVGDAVAVEFGRPQLDRQMHASQSLGREQAAEQGIGDHGRLDARIMDQRLCGNSMQPGFGAARAASNLRDTIAQEHRGN